MRLDDQTDHSGETATPRGAQAPPPPAPREITPHVKRRAWRERHTWVWVVLGLALLAVTLYYVGSRTWWWWREKRLIEAGTRVEATVKGWHAGQDSLPGKRPPPGTTSVDILYEVGGQSYRPRLSLLEWRGEIQTGVKVPIFVDPGDPSRWTARTRPVPLKGELLGAMLVAPAALVLLVVAWVKRRTVLRVYRDGDAVPAEVLGVGQTPSAPFSRLIRCALQHGEGARMVKTVLPARRNTRPGDVIWLIVPPGRPGPAIAAAVFE